MRLAGEELTSRQLEVRWVSRGGGAVLHTPGQLAVYVVAPLARLRWTVGGYLARLRSGLTATLASMGVGAESDPRACAIAGRTGWLAALGVAVQNWVTFHGAFINVCPAMQVMRSIDTAVSPDAAGRRSMSCLLAERGRSVTMSKVRSTLLAELASAFGAERHHLYSGHPLLNSLTASQRNASPPVPVELPIVERPAPASAIAPVGSNGTCPRETRIISPPAPSKGFR